MRLLIQKLAKAVAAIAKRDANAALAMHVDLLTNSTGNMGSWTVGRYLNLVWADFLQPGVKQLIRLGL